VEIPSKTEMYPIILLGCTFSFFTLKIVIVMMKEARTEREPRARKYILVSGEIWIGFSPSKTKVEKY